MTPSVTAPAGGAEHADDPIASPSAAYRHLCGSVTTTYIDDVVLSTRSKHCTHSTSIAGELWSIHGCAAVFPLNTTSSFGELGEFAVNPFAAVASWTHTPPPLGATLFSNMTYRNVTRAPRTTAAPPPPHVSVRRLASGYARTLFPANREVATSTTDPSPPTNKPPPPSQ